MTAERRRERELDLQVRCPEWERELLLKTRLHIEKEMQQLRILLLSKKKKRKKKNRKKEG